MSLSISQSQDVSLENIDKNLERIADYLEKICEKLNLL